MLRVGLNPYGLSYTVGLQRDPTSPAAPAPIGMSGFIDLAREIGAKCVELDGRWLAPLSDSDLARIGESIRESGMTIVCSDWLVQQPDENLAHAIRSTRAIGASLLRLHLTPVLEGSRSGFGTRWEQMVTHARTTLKMEARRAADAGVPLAIENHQDLTSEELIAMADEAGENVGLVFDTGNPFAVGEDPLAFARRAADRIRHVHLKDYVAQFTPRGYRLVRCAVGDGCVPLNEIVTVVPSDLTASIEPGALEARDIRLFAADWWTGYPPRQATELATALGRLQHHKLPEAAEWRTPWERAIRGQPLVDYEMTHIRRSVENLRAIGIMSA
jgi:sugar phosphate isomerase/epimerase